MKPLSVVAAIIAAVVFLLARTAIAAGDERGTSKASPLAGLGRPPNSNGMSAIAQELLDRWSRIAGCPDKIWQKMSLGTYPVIIADGFATGNSMGLTTQATAQGGLTAIAFNPDNPSELWVGGALGSLFKTTNSNNTGAGIVWQNVNTPISNALVQNIFIRTESGIKTVYISSFAGDVYFSSGAVLGFWKSTNEGLDWTNLSSSLYPCTSFWGFYPVQGSTSDFWGALWGAGLFKLSYQ